MMAAPKGRIYEVDGEEVSLSDIVARTKLSKGTLQGRLAKGLRTWASLGEDPAKAQRRNHDRMRKLMACERDGRDSERPGAAKRMQERLAKTPRNKDGSSRLA